MNHYGRRHHLGMNSHADNEVECDCLKLDEAIHRKFGAQRHIFAALVMKCHPRSVLACQVSIDHDPAWALYQAIEQSTVYLREGHLRNCSYRIDCGNDKDESRLRQLLAPYGATVVFQSAYLKPYVERCFRLLQGAVREHYHGDPSRPGDMVRLRRFLAEWINTHQST